MNQDVKALEEALAKGPTPGEWHTGGENGKAARIIYDERGWAIADAKLYHGNRESGEDLANAEFMAVANPDRISRLLDYIRKLEQEVANGK
ncbi:ead/Ea22-like family protein [Schlegelella sp. S2-27]|uniref:Ead/Ea22-like family protein n=1 Tax=Caldimonas mangrovi TaxID=2944811 RepID=A0ABT0YW06_9BURK|nr:ead/Ea22-like family protein [Caldimonas mangrovi]MCM5682941.1 ead/Ea22-like family protein [Caldimonas mangrovi]